MRGFFSLVIVALAALAIAAIAASVSSSAFASDARVAELDARLVSERADDAARVMNATLLDALLDSVYADCGCGAGTLAPGDIFADFSAAMTTYSTAAFQNFSSPLISAGASYALETFSVSSCNATFEANATVLVSANSTRAKKAVPAVVAFPLVIYRDASVFNATGGGVNLTVRC